MPNWVDDARWPILRPGEVHLWYCDIEASGDADEAYLALLDRAEHSRLERLRFAADRQQFLRSHALLRSVLARYLRCRADELKFARGDRGKPFLEAPGSAAALSFNLSHAGSRAVLVVVGGGAAVGVDIERHRPGRRFDALARRHFAGTEVLRLEAMQQSERVASFYDTWTLKEAYVKAHGQGLLLPLDGFWFSPGERAGELRFEARTDVEPDPRAWSFWSWREPAGYSVALALRDAGRRFGALHFDARPLREWRQIARASRAATFAA